MPLLNGRRRAADALKGKSARRFRAERACNEPGAQCECDEDFNLWSFV
jgi:hypothetical protein